MALFIVLHKNTTPTDVANTFLWEVWKLHALLTEIIANMEAKLSGEFWESMCEMLGGKRCMSMTYDPQTGGRRERTNQLLNGYLQTFVNYDQNDWYQLLPLAEHPYNN